MSKYIKVEDIMRHINTDNRGNCDYFIVDRIEELCNSDKTIDLADHDKQIRDEVIGEFTEKLEKVIKDDIDDEIISMFDGGTVMGAIKFIAEQMVE